MWIFILLGLLLCVLVACLILAVRDSLRGENETIRARQRQNASSLGSGGAWGGFWIGLALVVGTLIVKDHFENDYLGQIDRLRLGITKAKGEIRRAKLDKQWALESCTPIDARSRTWRQVMEHAAGMDSAAMTSLQFREYVERLEAQIADSNP